MSPMILGGVNDFMWLCKTVRGFDEFKFAYPGTATEYSQVTNATAINVMKKFIGGNICFIVESIAGSAYMAMTTIMDLLKIEKLIVVGFKTMEQIAPEVERRFNEFAGSPDLSHFFAEVENSGDLLQVEILANFSELFQICIENKKAISGSENEKASSNSSKTPTKLNKRNAFSTPKEPKEQKKTYKDGKVPKSVLPDEEPINEDPTTISFVDEASIQNEHDYAKTNTSTE